MATAIETNLPDDAMHPPSMKTGGAWAVEVKGAGLLGPDGVVLGKLDRDYHHGEFGASRTPCKSD